jgi:hypothetical protein
MAYKEKHSCGTDQANALEQATPKEGAMGASENKVALHHERPEWDVHISLGSEKSVESHGSNLFR